MADKQLWNRSYYFSKRYLNEGRFVDYYHAFHLSMQSDVQQILEIGPGNGILTWILRQAEITVTTFDVDERVRPDVVGDVRELPFEERTFDSVVCCQVLEHLPFETFSSILQQFYRVSKKYAVISLPHVIPVWSIIAHLPVLGSFWGAIKKPCFKPMDLSDHPEHYWSVGSKGCSENTVRSVIMSSGWKIKKCYRPGFNKDHIFYLLYKG